MLVHGIDTTIERGRKMTVPKLTAVEIAGLFFDQYGFNDRFEVDEKTNSITFTKQNAKQRIVDPKIKGFE